MREAEFRDLLAAVSGEHAYEMRAKDRGHDFLVEYFDSDGHTLVYAEESRHRAIQLLALLRQQLDVALQEARRLSRGGSKATIRIGLATFPDQDDGALCGAK